MGKSGEMYLESQQENLKPADSLEMVRKPLSLREQTQIVNATIIAIKDGTVDPIKTELSLKAMENIIKDIRSNQEVKSITRTESEKYGKTFKKFGAEIENSSRTTYKYENCNDAIWNDLKKQEAILKEQIKIREKQLQSGIDISSGEVLKQPISSTTSFLKITFRED